MKLRITNSPIPMIVIAAALRSVLNSFALAASGTWAFTGSLHNARDGQAQPPHQRQRGSSPAAQTRATAIASTKLISRLRVPGANLET